MLTEGRIQLQLEIETETEPITGLLRDPDGQTREFRGWLGLTSALEELAKAIPEEEGP